MASTSGAKNTDSDLAFDLQLQEALCASLESSSSPHHAAGDDPDLIGLMDDEFRRQEQEDEDRELSEALDASLLLSTSSSSQSQIPEPVAGFQSEDVSVFIGLMSAEINRLEQEYLDREMSEAEARRMRDDLNRRIHDQKVAAEILKIPEEDWANDGDNFEKPYDGIGGQGEESSSSSSYESDAVANEEFKVYVKGLVSEERLRDEVVRVSAVGVAICDSMDILRFEVKKKLDGDMNSDTVGFEALVEGMQAAIDLGLKKITCFCDEYMTYWIYKNVNDIEDEIPLSCVKAVSLEGNFTAFNLSLVARNGLKFAFKLARDAIVSQITWPAESSHEKKSLETCLICLEDVDIGQMFSVDGCLHRYCFSCMKQHVEVKLLNGTLPRCPHEGCMSNVIIDRCRSFLEPKFVDIMSQRIKERSMPATEKVYCPYPRCSTLMSKKEVLEYTNNEHFLGAERIGMRKCTTCSKLFCVNCKVPWHHNTTSCDEYRRQNPNASAEDVKLRSLASQKKWRQCDKCNQMIELSEGCYHMSCRCGHEFCYTCGAEWKEKKPTCSCPIWDEHNIIRT